MGKISLIAGEPKQGKSQLCCAIAAKVTTGGVFPDGSKAPRGSVIFISCEDDPADTIRPRLDAAGADVRKVHLFDWVVSREGDGVKRLHFDVSRHCAALEQLIRKIGDVRWLVIDPISAYLGKTDSHKTAEVRGALQPLQHLAGSYDIAIGLVSHLNKNTGTQSAMARVSGSGAFTAVARSGWLVLKDRDDPKRRLLCPLGSNVADSSTGYAFRIVGVDLGNEIKTSKIEFEDEAVPLDADELLGPPSGSRSAVDDACDLIKAELQEGPLLQNEIIEVARGAGLSSYSVKQAKKRLGVRSAKNGIGKWAWSLRTQVSPEIEFPDAIPDFG